MNEKYILICEAISLNEGIVSTIRRTANNMGRKFGDTIGKIAVKKGMTPEEARRSFKSSGKLLHNQKWNSYQKGFYNRVKQGY